MQRMMMAARVMGVRIHPRVGFPQAAMIALGRQWGAGETEGMDRAFINGVCAAFPGAALSDPWGGEHDAWKVGGKMFACIGARQAGVSVKTADVETAGLLIEMGRAERAPYFHRSWVFLPWGIVPEEEFRERLLTSYRIVRGGLPKKVQAALGPVPEA
jgi:predicted DNA-binding protein (MmcQ/YjbR family)